MPERLEEVTLVINGEQWDAWGSLEITRSLDTFRTVSFAAPFEHERPGFRETFRPFSYLPLELYVGEELLFTGTLLGVEPTTDPESRSVRVTAYSRPAVLNDVSPPASAYPLELNGLKFRQITETLLQPFDLEVELEADEGAAFRRVAIGPEQTIYAFLIDLAQQRGLVISDTSEGAFRVWQSTSTGEPVAQLVEGQAGLLAVQATFSPQEYFSELTAIAKTRSGRGGARYTVTNPHLQGVVRPGTVQLEDTDAADLPRAAEAKLGRMFGNVLTLTARLPTWRDPQGALFEPNTTLLLEAPGAMVYTETELLIRDVRLLQDAGEISSELTLVLPGAFSGEVPEVLPWA